MELKNFTYYIPTKVLFGFGALKKLHEEKLPGKNALIVTTAGKSVMVNGHLDMVMEELDKAGVSFSVYSGVKSNPTLENVMEGAEFAREEKCDFVIGLGGGSPMDCAKAIAIMAVNPGNYWDYMEGLTGKNKEIENDPLPIVCITTTAGTGSEVDPWLVTTKEETHEKLGFGYDKTYPVISVVDPELMMTVPPEFTAYQGMDVFFHAAESILNKKENPIGEMFALKAVEYVGKYLPRAVKDGSDREARYYMAIANSLAGFFMMTTSEHSFEHSLSAMKPELPHGAGLVLISRAWHSFFVNEGHSEDKYIMLAKALGYENALSGKDFIKALEKLKEECGLGGKTLSDWGFTEEEADKFTDLTYTLAGGRFENDPAVMNKEDVRDIYISSL